MHNEITTEKRSKVMTKNYLILCSAVIIAMMLTPIAIHPVTANATSSPAKNPTTAGTLPTPTKLTKYIGITVTANRIPAAYWDPCFATECAAGTGPGATMYFELHDSSGNLVASGYADENGYTFTGLDPLETYYVYPTNCYSCHDSTHDVLFQYWGDGNTDVPRAAKIGDQLDAWFSCTNGCSGD